MTLRAGGTSDTHFQKVEDFPCKIFMSETSRAGNGKRFVPCLSPHLEMTTHLYTYTHQTSQFYKRAKAYFQSKINVPIHSNKNIRIVCLYLFAQFWKKVGKPFFFVFTDGHRYILTFWSHLALLLRASLFINLFLFHPPTSAQPYVFTTPILHFSKLLI